MACTSTKLAVGGETAPLALSLEFFRRALTAYYVEERMKVFAKQGKCTFVAPGRGHEAVQVGMPLLLKPGYDWFFPYYRSKGTAVGLGLRLEELFLQMLGREGDVSSAGRNMPEHFSSKTLHLVSQTACTGSQYLPAVGMAKAVKQDGDDRIVYVESGEGATSEGEFFEALNWAGREKLPVLFSVQNNGYAISTPQRYQTGSSVSRIAEGFGIAVEEIDGSSFNNVYRAVLPHIEAMRAGIGPLLVEAHVARIESHSNSDDQRKYRPSAEILTAAQRDPVVLAERFLADEYSFAGAEIERIREEARAEVERAAEYADTQPMPGSGDLLRNIFAPAHSEESGPSGPASYVSSEPVTMIDAINHGLREEAALNPRLVMWGEDIGDPKGGVFGVTRGLRDAFGDRISNAPLAEASIAGVAGGMAMGGYKPIVEIQFGDYLWPAAMQLRDEIPTVRWRSNGAWKAPVVVRIAVGGYIKGGPWHSACVESFFAHIPGWHIAFPSSADDAKGLIKSAARSEDPVIFLEHKGLYRRMQAKSLEPDANYLVPFGRGRVRREGKELTIVTWGSTVYFALDLARQMEAEGRSLEVIDLRTIAPLDEELIYRSVRKTSRVVVAHEDSLTAGFGGEIAARLAQNSFSDLDAPIRRVAAEDSFVPSASNLELMVLPSLAGLRAAVEETLAY
jgi:2-oxoisovalerate dehydrogenase E1 component